MKSNRRAVMIQVGMLLATLWQGIAFADDLGTIRSILDLPEEQIDLGRTKLTIDKMIDPSVDIETNLRQIGTMKTEIKAMLPPHPSDTNKLQALQKYVYFAGEWNHYRTFSYDLDDPFGKNIAHKLLPNYLATRKGNCVSMPFLFIILGQRLGLNVTAALAPLHIFVKYRDVIGNEINLEITSGANPARVVWIRQQIPMTDEAVRNGVYLRALSKKETVAVMAETLIEYYMQQHRYEQAIKAADLVLEYSPTEVTAMLHKGSAYSRMIKEQFISKYPTPNLIPQEKRAYFEFLSRNNQYWFARAEALGWREPTLENELQYIKIIDKVRSSR